MDSDGKMDRLEFSIAMKLIKLTLQGRNLPSSLPIIMKQSPGSGLTASVPSAARFGNKRTFFCGCYTILNQHYFNSVLHPNLYILKVYPYLDICKGLFTPDSVFINILFLMKFFLIRLQLDRTSPLTVIPNINMSLAQVQ